MKILNYDDKRVLNAFFTALAAVFLLVMFAGCGGGNYGTLAWDRELDNTFARYQVLSDHRYYITGGYGAPAAILAIHNDYQLENDGGLWVPVPDVNSTHMQKWIHNLSPDVNYWQEKPFLAAYILDPKGNKVGAWYSGQRSTAVMFLEGNRVRVHTPDMKPSFGGDDREKGYIKP